MTYSRSKRFLSRRLLAELLYSHIISVSIDSQRYLTRNYLTLMVLFHFVWAVLARRPPPFFASDSLEERIVKARSSMALRTHLMSFSLIASPHNMEENHLN